MTTVRVPSASLLQRLTRLVLIGLVLYLAWQTARSLTRLFVPPKPIADVTAGTTHAAPLHQLPATGYWVFPEVRWKFGNFSLDDQTLRQRIEKTARQLRSAEFPSPDSTPMDPIEQAALGFFSQPGLVRKSLSDSLTLCESQGALRMLALVMNDRQSSGKNNTEISVVENLLSGLLPTTPQGRLAALWVCVPQGKQQLVVEVLPATENLREPLANRRLLPFSQPVTRLVSRWSEENELQLEQLNCSQTWEEIVAGWNKAGWQAEPLPEGTDQGLYALFRQNQQLILVYRLVEQGSLKLLVSRANPY